MSDMAYRPREPYGRPIDSDPYFTLMAGEDGVGFIHCGDGVIVVPLTDDGGVLLAVERAAAFDREVLGLVGGEAEEGKPLAETANRELQEELGWRAGRIDFLGELHPFKYLTSRQFAFLARDLTPSKLEGDEIYPVGARAVPLARFVDLVESGELQDATAVAALVPGPTLPGGGSERCKCALRQARAIRRPGLESATRIADPLGALYFLLEVTA
jgi:8-oxo-dGTP pyrophosphatase MutT (NUDIX family)